MTQLIASNQLTLTNVNDGTNGLAGKAGVGINSTAITYASHTNGTTAPTTGYTTTVPSVPAGQFLWTKTVWTYTDNSSKTGYSVARMGLKGDKGDPGVPGIKGSDGTSGIIVSSVAPASPKTGQLWQDTSTTPQLVKKWTGTSWVIWELYVENMNVNNLSALSPNLGNITGGSYTSWSVDIDPGGNPILNGVYLYNGRLRSVSITNPISTDPKKVGGIVNSRISGMEMFGGYTDYYHGEYKSVNGTAEDMIKGLNSMSFWSQLNGTGAYIGRIVGFQLPDKDPYILISAPRLLVGGSLSISGDMVVNNVPMNTTSSVTVVLFYSITGIFRRQGNLVIVSFERQIRAPQTTGEDKLTTEKIPSGYRPSYSHYFEISRNANSTVKNGLIMGIAPNGDVRVTLGETGAAVFSGSTSYFTEDPLP